MKQLIVKFISQAFANPNEFVLRIGEFVTMKHTDTSGTKTKHLLNALKCKKRSIKQNP